MQRYFKITGHFPEVLFNVSAVAGFPKNGVIDTMKDTKIAEEIVKLYFFSSFY